MKLARNVAQRRFLRGDQFLRQVAALFGKLRQPSKNLAITAYEIQTRQNYRDECCRQEEVELALNSIVDLRDARGGLLFAFVVFYQQARNRRAEGLLPRLQRQANLLP